MNSTNVRVDLGERSYDILISNDDALSVGQYARSLHQGQLAFVVTDDHVAPIAEKVAESLQRAHYQTEMAVLTPGEERKSLGSAEELYDRLIALHADRNTLVVPVGGGVIGDLGGFVAATYLRGVPLLMVPTTLLAMVDSSVGGKTAVNHPRAKNMIGVFHQPLGVWIDTATLESLPDREFRSGLAEVVKYGVILDADFFTWLEENTTSICHREADAMSHVVAVCCRLKAAVVGKDERDESGLRAVLNYGHTFAHAFERAAGYSSWLHGEAVAAGMMCAAKLACNRGLVGSDVVERQEDLLRAFQLPIVAEPWPSEELLTSMRSDKKAIAGQMRFVLPRRLGEVALFDDIKEEEVVECLRR